MIEPTVGRIVWYHPGPTGVHAAIITHVHGDDCVNLVIFDANGVPYQRTSVTLLQGEKPEWLTENYAEWMPYQKGQAAKTEQLKAALEKKGEI